MKKILVVDDEESVRTLLGRFLKAANYEVIFAEDGLKALEMVKSSHPDLVLADITMPMLDGIGLCSIIKKDKNFTHIPVVMLTGKGTIGDAEEALKEGPDGYITKPFDPARLLHKVQSLLDK